MCVFIFALISRHRIVLRTLHNVTSHRTYDLMITSLLRQTTLFWRNDVKMTSFWRYNDVIITSYVRWDTTTRGVSNHQYTVYPNKYAHGFVVLCFVVVKQSFIMNSHEVFIHIHQGCFAGTGAIVRLPQCQWSKPDGYGKISQCITTTKHSKAKTVCIILGIYCII